MHAQVYPPSRTTQFVFVGRGGVDAEELIVPSTRARRARRPRQGRLWALLRPTYV